MKHLITSLLIMSVISFFGIVSCDNNEIENVETITMSKLAGDWNVKNFEDETISIDESGVFIYVLPRDVVFGNINIVDETHLMLVCDDCEYEFVIYNITDDSIEIYNLPHHENSIVFLERQ